MQALHEFPEMLIYSIAAQEAQGSGLPSSPVVPAWNLSLAVDTAITASSVPLINPARKVHRALRRPI